MSLQAFTSHTAAQAPVWFVACASGTVVDYRSPLAAPALTICSAAEAP